MTDRKTFIRLTVAAWAICVSVVVATAEERRQMTARVIQPLFAMEPEKLQESFEWQLKELDRCTQDDDIIVLPEYSEAPGKTTTAGFFEAVSNNNARLRQACSETARRCQAVVFVGAVDITATGPRNAIFAYDTQGKCVGRYYKQHLTAGERTRRKMDDSYTKEWSRPYILEIDGVRYGFLICYDFYFYESYCNLARSRPDVIIGCSHQRSDRLDVLEVVNSFCAYNTGAYLVRASVSMGVNSPVGGSSMIVSPAGKILCNLRSQIGSRTATFDPHEKYLKPAGWGNPQDTHPAYVEMGRRPWKYRPAGSAIVPPFSEGAAKRLCAHRGFSTVAPENSLAAFGAAVALGASEIEFDLWWTKDGEIVSIHDPTLERVSTGSGFVYEKTYDELKVLDCGIKTSPHFKGLGVLCFEDILCKLSCHTIMNIHVKSLGETPWNETLLRKMVGLIDDYDARGYVYFTTSSGTLQDQLARIAPDIPRCMGHAGDSDFSDKIIDRAVKHGCKMIQLFKPHFTQETIARAHALGLRCNLFWADDPAEAKRYLDMGIDTVLTNDYQPIAFATGLR